MMDQIEYFEDSESLRILTKDESGEPVYVMVPLQAIASTSELLGYTDAIDCLDAIVRSKLRHTEYYAEQSNDLWTNEYVLLREMETAREEEAQKAVEAQQARAMLVPAIQAGDTETEAEAVATLRRCGPTDTREARTRGADAVLTVLSDIAGKDCGMEESPLAVCQKRTRDALKVPDPVEPPTASRLTIMTCDPDTPHCAEDPCADKTLEFDAEDRAKCARVLKPLLPELIMRRARFCHTLSGRDTDPHAEDYTPAGPQPAPVEEPETDPLEAIRQEWAGYTERQDHAA